MRAAAILALEAFAIAVCHAPSLLAQSPAPSATLAHPIAQNHFGDRGGDGGAFSGYIVSAPLRLSLQASVFPKASLFPNCVSREDDAGNSVGGIPLQQYSEFRLMPRLMLSGFARVGCPIDAGIGGALTYSVPIRESMRAVFGLGLYAVPGQSTLFGDAASLLGSLRGGASSVNEAGRIDLVWNTKSNRTFHLGVESIGLGMQGIRFGGGF